MSKGFYWLSKSHYGPANLGRDPDLKDELMIGNYCEDGGTTGEFAIRWFLLSGRITPRLEAWDDSWMVLSGFTALIDQLGKFDSDRPEPEDVVELLKSLGFKDLTKYAPPVRVCPKCGQGVRL